MFFLLRFFVSSILSASPNTRLASSHLKYTQRYSMHSNPFASSCGSPAENVSEFDWLCLCEYVCVCMCLLMPLACLINYRILIWWHASLRHHEYWQRSRSRMSSFTLKRRRAPGMLPGMVRTHQSKDYYRIGPKIDIDQYSAWVANDLSIRSYDFAWRFSHFLPASVASRV